MAQVILIPNLVTKSTSRITLGGNTFKFELVWFSRQSRWVMSIYDADDGAIIEGVSLLPNQEVTTRYPEVTDKLLGQIVMATNTNSTSKEITKENVNTDYSLVYISTQELEGG